MKFYLKPILASVILGGAISCTAPQTEVKTDAPALDLSNMDTTVAPQENFFQYVNGSWIEKTEIPADRGRWGSFDGLRDRNEEILIKVLKDAISSNKLKAGSDEQKAADFYASGMDTVAIEEAGLEPLIPYLEQVEGIKNLSDLQNLIAEFHTIGNAVFFGVGVYQDLKKSDEMAFYIGQAGLGLPNKDYYTKDDDKSEEIRKKYRKYIQDVFVMLGKNETEATALAAKVWDIEMALADQSWNPVELRDYERQYNPMSIQEVQALTPSFNWTSYLNDIGAQPEKAIVSQVNFVTALENVFSNTSIEDLKAYMYFHIADNGRNSLNTKFSELGFDFYGKTLRGLEAMSPRWKRILRSTNGSAGFALGKLYVQEAFPAEAKERANTMVSEIKEAFKNRIENLEWMTDETKAQALRKLAAFNVKIGYPDKWETYEDLDVSGDYIYYKNVVNSNKFGFKKNMNELGKPVDATKWGMTPQTVNAYYHPLYNEIVFPAAILQPPFFNFKADDAVNFGGIGAVIGHEITHGFDDNGSRFDAEGNMKMWWTDADRQSFDERAQVVVEQFNGYEPIKGLNVNGKLTLGENIADLGGLSVAYDALQAYYAKNGRPEDIDGFTAEQRFFMSWATIWRTKSREAALRQQIMTDTHSPGEYRANGPLTNMDVFYKAFDVKDGDAMKRPSRLKASIW
ncbi:M13 family metallopeptidase [Sediminitomix flava]|uniref:Putative endopeptidase n=1 Tax=Sediminitomix flava TaxID=379075 RepID=A0A315ZF78_SEDFL|nr:M13 family metallopeptidase [Sediminitomix flava]PWJ43982.1 putative endopeptidase [Sediminitomix flava]